MRKKLNYPEEYEKEFHWLSAICFIERMSPSYLVIDADLEQRLTEELKLLREIEPLGAFALSLKIVSQSQDLRIAEERAC